ncbi:MAG: SPOR domain-containing protein [Breznakibacter sp.]
MKYSSIAFVVFGILLSINSSAQDKLSKLRTEKKIITADAPTSPYYAIQILALTLPPQEPEFFKNIDLAREFACADGYVRYVVGQYATFADANIDLEKIRSLGYNDAFVVNTRKLGAQASGFAAKKLEIDPAKTYTIQLSAFRFPVYLSYFENVDGVMEFYMKDKIYRYCVGKHPGSVVENELAKLKGLGYKDAYIVELDAYLPYQIE